MKTTTKKAKIEKATKIVAIHAKSHDMTAGHQARMISTFCKRSMHDLNALLALQGENTHPSAPAHSQYKIVHASTAYGDIYSIDFAGTALSSYGRLEFKSEAQAEEFLRKNA